MYPFSGKRNDSSTVKMEESCPSESLVLPYHIPYGQSTVDVELQCYRCENLILLTPSSMPLPPKMAVIILWKKCLFLCGHIHTQFIIISVKPCGRESESKRRIKRTLNSASPIKKLRYIMNAIFIQVKIAYIPSTTDPIHDE
jgi:hypothetical protein